MNQFKYSTYNPRPYEIHDMAIKRIQEHNTILELGCATGYITKILTEKRCKVTGIEIDPTAAKEARKYGDVLLGDLNKPSSIALNNKFDVILCLDVIEHLINRKELLKTSKKWMHDKSIFILSTPNIAHLRIRLKLLRGIFTYTTTGVMDETHVHFYTKETLEKEFTDAGFTILEIAPSADLGQIPLFGVLLYKLPKRFQHAIVSLAPTLLAVQWLVVAKLS